MFAEEIIEEFNQNVDKFVDGTVFHQGSITGVLEKACGGKENRYLVLKVLTGHTSSKDLNNAQWNALYHFVKPYKPEGGKWTTQRGENELAAMCGALLTLHATQEGQIDMFGGS